MGFRSTLISQHYAGIKIPDWFREKYGDEIVVMDGTLLASKTEFKIYDNEIFEDLQRALIECGFFTEKSDWFCFVVAVLHEDNMISKVEITDKVIRYFWMDSLDIIEMDFVWQG